MLIAKKWNSQEQSLQDHIKDALETLREYLTAKWNIFESFCLRWNIHPTRLAKSTFFTVALHDAGKATLPFQKAIKENKDTKKYVHPFFAIPVITELSRKDILDPLLPEIGSCPLLETLAILAHHTQLYHGLYEDINQNISWHEQIIELPGWLRTLYRNLGFDKFFTLSGNFELDFDRLNSIKTATIEEFIQRVQAKIQKYPVKEKVKSIYCYLVALLKICDITSSINFTLYASGHKKAKTHCFIQDIPGIGSEEILKGKVPYPYQKEISNDSTPFSMLLAPCGRGKTEAAAIWATNIAKTYNLDRIIFAMPTQVTSNAMKERLSKYFRKENVGLYHGRSFAELKTKAKEEEKWDFEVEEARDENFRSEVYLKPVTVTTVDHLLYTMLHGFPKSDFACGNLQTAAIVFDEIHCYEKHLLGHLKLLFRILRKMNIPHLLMSGTFPEFLRDEISKDIDIVKPYTFIKDEEGLKYTPFIIERRNSNILNRNKAKEHQVSKEFVQEVVENYKQKLIQFIILNTVPRSQGVYRTLRQSIPEKDLILLHSRFTYSDRRAKETIILRNAKGGKRPFILVATQVIEVSLDISSEVMYTELSPMDALGQRGGRLNRGNKTPCRDGFTYKLIVHQPEDILPYRESEMIIKKTDKILPEGRISYSIIKNLCDKAYEEVKLGYSKFLEIFDHCTLFGYSHKEIRWSEEEGKLFQTRKSEYPTIDVIPEVVFEEEGDEALSPENLAPIPLWWYMDSLKKNNNLFILRKKGNRQYIVSLIHYDKNIGFKYDREQEEVRGVII